MGEPVVWVRAVHFAATLSVTGAVLFVALLAEPAFRKADDRGEVSARVRPWFSVIEWVSLALVVVSGAAWLVIQSAQMGDVPWSEAVSEGLVQTVLLGTGFGNDWIARTVLAALLAVTLAVARPARGSSRRADWLACVLAVALAGTLAWAGHAAGTPDALGVVHVASDVLHLVAASAWVGALVPLAIVISSALIHSDPAASAVARETVLRFSTLGAVSVGTLVATGLVNPSFPTQAKKPAISKEGPQKSSLQGRCGGLSDLASRGDPWSRLGGQVKVELLHQQFLIGIEFRVAAED